MNVSLEKIASVIKDANSVLIIGHMRPDGDDIGSVLALSRALDLLGIPNEACVETDIPANLRFVEGIDKIKKAPTREYDLLIVVDSSDEQRLGNLSEEFFLARRKKIDTINVDHHVSNTRFAKYNYVRQCAANCMNIASLTELLGVSFDKLLAEYLFIGLLTDSGDFSHDDVDEEAFLLAAKLIKTGADLSGLQYALFKKQSKQRAALYAKVVSGIRYYHDDRFAVVITTREAISACGAEASMTEGFVDFPLSIDGVEVAAALLEVRKGQYKISLRSKSYVDANKLAGVFGGGGHVRAAGYMLFGELEEVLDKLSYAVSQYLE